MLVVGLVIYIIPPRHGETIHLFNLICALVAMAVIFYLFFVKKQVVQITINPTQNKIETLHQNGLNQQSTIVQPLNQVTTEYLNYSTRGGKDYTLVIKDKKNIIRITDNLDFSSATLLEIKQTIDSYKS